MVCLNVLGFPPLHLFSISLATFPLDLTKTRLQMQGEAALARLGDGAVDSAPYRGMVRTALGIELRSSDLDASLTYRGILQAQYFVFTVH